MKDLRDIKKEYGYVLRWYHHTIEEGEQEKEDWLYLENINNDEKIEIVNIKGVIINKEAYDYIISKTYNAFRNNYNIYANYARLFEIMSIEKKIS